MVPNTTMILIMGVILIFLLFSLYYYSYTRRNHSVIREIDYPEKVKLTNLPMCHQIDNSDDDTILSDYYIASSFNSACIGNQKFDYVSLEMLETVLRSGARYIELQICQEALQSGSKPVIATGDKTGKWINSLNTLNIHEALNVVSRMAFVKTEGSLNYPLFIYLNLKTDDKTTLDLLADTIKQYLSKRLLEPAKYHKYPIAHERICKLLNKVILLSSQEHVSSDKLTQLIIPSDNYIQRIKHTEIDQIINNDTSQKAGSKPYHKILSRKAQEEDSEHFKAKYKDLSSLTLDHNYLRDLQTDDTIVDVLGNYNKAGLTVVLPHNDTVVGTDEEADVFSLNYDISNAMRYGCQFISMNYQIHDDKMDAYIDMFKESSFILKPTGLRFHKSVEPVEDIMNKYPVKKKLNYTIHEDFVKTMNGKLVAIQLYSNQDLYLQTDGENLKFSGVPIKNRIVMPDKTIRYKHPIEQCFLLTQSRSRRFPNGIMISTAKNTTQFLSLGSDYVQLNNPRYDDADVKLATFLPIHSVCGSDTQDTREDTWKGYLSFASLDKDSVSVIGNYNGFLKEYRKSPNTKVIENTCFHLVDVPHRKYVELKHNNGGYVMVDEDGILRIGMASIPSKQKEQYKLEIITDEIWEKDEIAFVAHNGKYLRMLEDNTVIADASREESSRFILDILHGNYVIRDKRGLYLTIKKGSGIRSKNIKEMMYFVGDKPLLKPAVVENGKTVSVAVYGKALNLSKYFKVRFQYNPM
jgi:hypothetical protein